MQISDDKKSNNLDNIRKRIIYFVDTIGGGRALFMASTNIKRGMFDPKDIDRAVGSDKISNILDYYKNLNSEWLLTGKGSILKDKSNTPKAKDDRKVNEPNAAYLSKQMKADAIPLVEIYAIAGFGSGNFSVAEQDVKDYYVIPKFKDRKIDFMIEVSGSSMYPKYSSGDVVACRIVTESGFIQWNKVHVVATKEQGILIKRLRKGTVDKCLLAVSDNEVYEPFNIPLKEIDGIAIVVGVIRLE